MGLMRLREVATLWLALLSAGCETAPDLQHPRFYLSDGISFRYPGNWSVTDDMATSTCRGSLGSRPM